MIHVYIALCQPQAWFADVTSANAQVDVQRIVDEFRWLGASTAETLITEGDGEPVLRPINFLPRTSMAANSRRNAVEPRILCCRSAKALISR